METDAAPFVSENTFRDNPSPTQSGNLHLYTDTIKKIQDYSTFYDLHDHRKRIAVVFNQYEFDDKVNLTQRIGTNDDCVRIIESLNKLKFEVTALQNPTFFDIDEQIGKVAAMTDKEINCVVVVVMTHGEPEGSLCARDRFYSENELSSPLKNASGLAGVPKIFIIQACRGSRKDLGKRSTTTSDSTEMNNEHTIPRMADMLWMYSTFRGYSALREEDGTWFIQTLCVMLDEYGTKEDIMQVLMKVNLVVAKLFVSRDGWKQMPEMNFTLTKNLSFQPRPSAVDRLANEDSA